MNKIVTFNECYSSNLGDQAISESLNKVLFDYNLDYKNIYLRLPKQDKLSEINYSEENKNSNNQTNSTLKGFLYLPYWYYKNNRFLRKIISENDIFIIGGGQIINSAKKKYPAGFSIFLYVISKLIKKYNKKLVFLGVGSASKFSNIEKKMYQFALNQADLVIVRDVFSKKMLNKIYSIQADVMPDIAFYKSKNSSPSIFNKQDSAILFVTDSNVVEKYSKTVFNFSEYFNLLEDKYKELSLEFKNVYLAYTTKEDAYECYNFQKYLIKKNYQNPLVLKIDSLKKLEEELATCKKVFAGRMHALILAKKHNCEIDAHLLSEKLENFMLEYENKSINEIQSTINTKLDEVIKKII